MKTILRNALTAFLIGGLWLPAQADEIEKSLQTALESYQAGDIKAAKEEIDFAAQLIRQMKAAGLSDFLPEALPDWTRAEGKQAGRAMMALGSGMSASAIYARGKDKIEIQIMAENQMVSSMAMMFGNAGMMSSMGQIKRIKRQKVAITKEGDVKAMIDNRIFVQVTGRAPVEDKEAYFAAINLRGLKDF